MSQKGTEFPEDKNPVPDDSGTGTEAAAAPTLGDNTTQGSTLGGTGTRHKENDKCSVRSGKSRTSKSSSRRTTIINSELKLLKSEEEYEMIKLKREQEERAIEEDRRAREEEKRAREEARKVREENEQKEKECEFRLRRAKLEHERLSDRNSVCSSRSSIVSAGAQGHAQSGNSQQKHIQTWVDGLQPPDGPPVPDPPARGPVNVSSASPLDLVNPNPNPQSSTRLNPTAGIFHPPITSTPGVDPRSAHVDPSDGGQANVDMGNLAQAIKELAHHNLLPPSKINRFAGDILEYSAFKYTFTWKVERNVTDPRERLNQLLNNVDGHPRDLIQGCRYMEPTEGYADAWATLDKEYGSIFKMEKAYMIKLQEWKRLDVKDVMGLKKFSAYLGTIRRALGANLRTLDSPSQLEVVAKKLPSHLLGRWCRVVDRTENEMGSPVTFKTLVDFVEREARVADVSSRVFDNDKKPTPAIKDKGEDGKKDKLKPTHKSFSIGIAGSTEGYDTECKVCEKPNHDLLGCSIFAAKTVKERRSLLSDVAKMNTCFRCLKPYRVSGRGTCKCGNTCSRCNGTHHHLLCDPSRSVKKKKPTVSKPKVEAKEVSEDKAKEESPKEDTSKESKTMSCSTSRDKMLLAIAPARVRHRDGNVIETYAFIDSGCMTTICSKELAQSLGVEAQTTDITLKTQAGDYRCNNKTSLTIEDIEGENTYKIGNVYITDTIAASIDDMVQREWLSKWPHLSDIELPRFLPGTEVQMIVGLNTVVGKTVLEARNGSDDEPSALKTPLGWIVHGPTGPEAEGPAVNFVRTTADELNTQLEVMFNRDFPEREVDSLKEQSVEDQRFMDKVRSSIKFTEGQYEVGLPLKDGFNLPNNKEIAVNRLKGLKRRFQRDEEYRQLYTKNVESLITKGYAEPVPKTSVDRADGGVWYLCHHGVRHPVKVDKLRVVFDCSCEYKNTSLNAKLLQGPDLTCSLVGVLQRFRHGQIAIAGDIEEMFHRVRVPVQDRDVLRFLWWPNGDLLLEPVEYRLTVHPFGATSSPSCVNYALRQTALDNTENFTDETVQSVCKHFYVDNYFKAEDSPAAAISAASQMIALCQSGGWRLNQWLSSDKDVLAAIPASERDKSVQSLDLYKEDLPMERALGVHWSMAKDAFTFEVMTGNKPRTRRGVLSQVMSVYDPLGIASPFTLPAKTLMQDMCRRKMSWDEHLSEDEYDRWSSWLDELPRLSELSLPRSFAPKNFGKVTRYDLHHFCDASQVGYGVVSYLRLTNEDGQVHCAFVFGKARVAPIKSMTIPRLELTAAAMSARIDRLLRKELDLPICSSTFWTDSTTVLKYLRNEHARFHTFVHNRVSLIREITDVADWRYVDTKRNPADLASRGASIEEFLGYKEWLDGPSFLLLGEEDWPSMPEDVRRGTLDDDAEVKRAVKVCANKLSNTTLLTDLCERASTWPRLVRTVAMCKRFINICRGKAAAKRNNTVFTTTTGPITMEEQEEAALAIWKVVQESSYAKELVALQSSPPLSLPKRSSIVKLKPILKDGILRAGGRLSSANIAFDAMHPIILPRDSVPVQLYVRWRHTVLGHVGVNQLITDLRDSLWIVKCRSLVRSIVRACVTCRRIDSRPLIQEMADLPKDRVCAEEPPFTRVGTDCFGPFVIRKGRSDHKRYGLIFTCLASRAVHLEVLESLETDSFINGLRRFVARRGAVKTIRSDNGSNFVGADKELAVEMSKLNQDKITSEMGLRGICWKFNPPYASHFGGVWERLIRSVRRVLKGILLQQRLTDEVLVTVMCEVESILNSRPLTAISDDINDPQPLTPAHLLTLRSPEGPPCLTTDRDTYSKRRWRQVQYLADVFWRRWVREYLPSLQERSKWSDVKRDLAVGDVVLVVDVNSPRCSWPLGKVLEVKPDKVGRVRKAVIKTKNGEVLRPLSKICMILENDLK